jgi:hypothetical protein
MVYGQIRESIRIARLPILQHSDGGLFLWNISAKSGTYRTMASFFDAQNEGCGVGSLHSVVAQYSQDISTNGGK